MPGDKRASLDGVIRGEAEQVAGLTSVDGDGDLGRVWEDPLRIWELAPELLRDGQPSVACYQCSEPGLSGRTYRYLQVPTPLAQ